MLDPTSYKPSPTNEILDFARWKLERGWVGRAPDPCKKEVCLSTAVRFVDGGDDELHAIRCINYAAAALAHKLGFRNVPDYNDARGRTKKQALAFFEEVRSMALAGGERFSKVLRVFDAAHDDILRSWVGRNPRSHLGEVCIATALRKAADMGDVLWVVMEAGRRAAKRHGFESIAAYNDAPGRTAIDVNYFLNDARTEALNIVVGDIEGRAALPLAMTAP